MQLVPAFRGASSPTSQLLNCWNLMQNLYEGRNATYRQMRFTIANYVLFDFFFFNLSYCSILIFIVLIRLYFAASRVGRQWLFLACWECFMDRFCSF